MSVEPASPAAPVAETGDAAASDIGQSASTGQAEGQSQSDSFDMDGWIRGKAFGAPDRSTLTPDGVVPTAELASAAPGESAPTGDVSPGVVPPGAAGDAGATAQPGRRAAKAIEAAATIESLQAEIETLRSSIPDQVAEVSRRADEARAEADRLRAEQAAVETLADETIGTPEEYARLLEIPDEDLTNEEYARRERWKTNRKVYRPVQTRLAAEEQARASNFVNSVRQAWGQRALQVADKRGLDKGFLADPQNHDLDTLLEHACSVTEARVRAEYAERLSQTERDRDTARGEAISGRRSPITNGAASAGAANGFDMETWIRQRAGMA